MPKSRIRKKADYTPPPAKQATNIKLTSNTWVAPAMLAMFLIGLAWIVVFYVTDGTLPIDALDNWNIVVGFGFIAAEDTKEYFFHRGGLDSSLDFDRLVGGERVEFDVEQSPKGPRAVRVHSV